MDSFNRLLYPLLALSLLMFVFSGCTKKDNLTGNNWSDTHALTVNDTLGISQGFSFPAETLAKISGSELKLLAANSRTATAISYLRFTDMPASADIVQLEHADSCYLSLKVLKRSATSRNPIALQLYKVKKALPDTLANLPEDINVNTDLEIIEGASVGIPDTISVLGLVVKVPIPISALFNWECPEDSTGWNLAVKVDSGWIELASAEGSYGPTLYFKYKTDDTATSYTAYKSLAKKDSYTLDAPLATQSLAWKIDNLTSQRMFIKYDPTYSLFRNAQGNSLSAQDLKRMTINQAKLVLYIKPNTNTYFTGTSTYSLFPFNVVKDSVNAPINLVKADYEIILHTDNSTGLVENDYIEIDVTPLIQGYTSGDKTPKGIMIQSMQERQNFGSLEFYDCFSVTPIDKKPYIRITYTPPFL